MSEEREIVDYYCYGCGDEEGGGEYDEKQRWWWSDKMSWAVDAGKKLVITGFVVSSAPVVLPPLLVVSALGLAMSVPFVFVFAAYASANKLMTKLLPETAEKIDKEHRLEWVGSDVTDDDVDDGDEQLMHDRYDDGEVGGEREGEKNGGDVGTRLEEEREREMKDVESPEQEIPTSDENESENIDIEASNVDEEASKREELDSEKSNEQVSLIIEDGASGGGGGSLDKHDEGIELPAVAAALTTVPEPDLDIGHKGGERDGGYVSDGDSSDSIVLNGDRHSDKELEGEIGDEKKIWEKIDAIRVIVGFKAPRRSSSLEELKALYLFTGIDPPSAPSPSPSSQLDDKVNFLMSVLGLKL